MFHIKIKFKRSDVAFALDLQEQCTKFTIQGQYNNCSIQLDHSRNAIPITGLYILTITALGVPTCQG